MKKLFLIILFGMRLHAMEAPKINEDAKSRCQQALQKIQTMVDSYIANAKGDSKLKIKDLRTPKPILHEECPATKQGLLLEAQSRMQLYENSLQYYVRTSWGLFLLIAANNLIEPRKETLLPGVIFAQGSCKPVCIGGRMGDNCDFIDEGKFPILKVDDIELEIPIE